MIVPSDIWRTNSKDHLVLNALLLEENYSLLLVSVIANGLLASKYVSKSVSQRRRQMVVHLLSFNYIFLPSVRYIGLHPYKANSLWL